MYHFIVSLCHHWIVLLSWSWCCDVRTVSLDPSASNYFPFFIWTSIKKRNKMSVLNGIIWWMMGFDVSSFSSSFLSYIQCENNVKWKPFEEFNYTSSTHIRTNVLWNFYGNIRMVHTGNGSTMYTNISILIAMIINRMLHVVLARYEMRLESLVSIKFPAIDYKGGVYGSQF